jgi:hypothetical protein
MNSSEEESSSSSFKSADLEEIGIKKVARKPPRSKKDIPPGLLRAKKQLLVDIEARGGISQIGTGVGKLHSFSSIVQSRPKIYEPWKAECQEFIYYWRKNNNGNYLRAVVEFGIKDLNRATQEQPRPAKPASRKV